MKWACGPTLARGSLHMGPMHLDTWGPVGSLTHGGSAGSKCEGVWFQKPPQGRRPEQLVLCGPTPAVFPTWGEG